MKIILCWKNKKILETEKIDNKYFSKIIIENFENAVDTGFPYALISDIKVIGEELPKIILSRLDKNVSLNNENELVECINTTHLERQTDFISVYVEE